MKRRDFLKISAFTAGAFAGGCGSSTFMTNQTPSVNGKKPNFLFIITDDQRFSAFGAMDNPDIHTPNMDKLASRGVMFTHSFNQGSWSGAVCLCSRGMLNCGQYLFHTEKNITKDPLWGETLRKGGYETFLTGKWHNGGSIEKSFSKVDGVGPGMYMSTKENEDGYNRGSADSTWKPYDKTRKGHWIEDDGKIIHSSEHWANHAVKYLSERKESSSEQPYFMYVAFNAPHDPRQSPKRFIDMYPLEDMKVPANYLPEHPFDQGEKYKLRDERLAPFPRTEEAVRLHMQEYYAICSHADEQIGRIIDALDETGEADNTYIIFTSDHGIALGCHGLLGKQNQYDDSIRMPLVMCGPNLKAGKKIDDMVYLQSMFATTCDLAGIETPSTVEFKSLVPLLQGTGTGEKEIFGSYKSLQRMIRTERYKLIMYPEAKETQLFDLVKDPGETKNLAYDKKYYEKVFELFLRFKDLQKKVGDEFVIESPYFTK